MRRLFAGLVMLILVSGIISCGGGSNFWDSNIYVNNYTSQTLDVYMNTQYYFTIPPGESETIESVEPGSYTLVALINTSHIQYATIQIEEWFDDDYTWDIR